MDSQQTPPTVQLTECLKERFLSDPAVMLEKMGYAIDNRSSIELLFMYRQTIALEKIAEILGDRIDIRTVQGDY